MALLMDSNGSIKLALVLITGLKPLYCLVSFDKIINMTIMIVIVMVVITASCELVITDFSCFLYLVGGDTGH